MSFVVSKYFSRFKTVSKELIIVKRVCIHCSTTCRQKDEEAGVYSKLVGPPQTLRTISKEDMISRAMKNYLERKQKADEKMNKLVAEYDLGKRHLANIMGVDEDELTTEKIREAISYLLPSGLFNKRSRPEMEHPTFYLPYTKGQEFDTMGRPNHYLYYTLKPKYYQLMHELAWKLERLKGTITPKTEKKEQEEVTKEVGVVWISQQDFLGLFPQEKVSEHDYKRFLVLIQRLADHPLANKEKAFIDKYRTKLTPESFMMRKPKIKTDEHGREFVICEAKRKTSVAVVKMLSKGHGIININGQDITYFKEILHRQAMLAPLQLCGLMDKFDIEATVTGKGPTADAGAIRLAVAKGLVSFIPEDMAERLRIAGYLTSDPRRRERKKPGQEGARKKFTWKRR